MVRGKPTGIRLRRRLTRTSWQTSRTLEGAVAGGRLDLDLLVDDTSSRLDLAAPIRVPPLADNAPFR